MLKNFYRPSSSIVRNSTGNKGVSSKQQHNLNQTTTQTSTFSTAQVVTGSAARYPSFAQVAAVHSINNNSAITVKRIELKRSKSLTQFT